MSPDTYEKFYWPCLKRCIMTVIENEMTPVVFCEGNYNTRLEVISDVPKGKVVYMFEKVDLKKAKATVGKVGDDLGKCPKCYAGIRNAGTGDRGDKTSVGYSGAGRRNLSWIVL